jgi:hypothetical protein
MIRFKEYFNQYSYQLNELTISPNYQSKGVFNPFYTLNIDVEKDIRPKIQKDGEIKFKSVDSGRGEQVKLYGRGKYDFQIVVDDVETNFYITTTKSKVTGHYGQKTRKDSTASSNVNEFLSLYFLLHKDYNNSAEFQSEVAGLTGPTGVKYADGKNVTYEDLVNLLDRDETADRDIEIGYQNALAVEGDLGSEKFAELYWVPRGKPGGVGAKNPSDIIIKLASGKYVGYSNKIAAGKDETPKFNTNIVAFYSKLGNTTQVRAVQSMIDNAWNKAAQVVPNDKENAKNAIMNFDISKEKFSESSSRRAFANLAKAFQQDRLNFYGKDFYYNFRNGLISSFGEHLKNPRNLVYFLNTVGYYTFDDPNSTPCPYKLLVGSVKGSKIKNVSENEGYRQMLFNEDVDQLNRIRFDYDNNSQKFTMHFVYDRLNYRVQIPITVRTRTAGGWSGKALYINTPGFVIK